VATLNLPMVVLFVTPYSVARYEPRRRAWAGLVLCLGAPLAAALPAPAAGGLVFSLGMVGASWTAGRAIRANSRHAQALRRQAARDDAAREEVQRLALAAERSRIARELQAVVVASVSEMVLAAETACRLVEESPEDADLMMDSVDVAARQVLADVRRVLGILRDPDEPVGLAPLPGIGHLDELRAVDGRGARLLVVGSARPVPASVDLGVFRIAESALASVREHPSDEPLEVGLRYAPGSVEIELSVGGQPCAAWPTPTMREWADVCGARLGSEPHGSEAHGSMERFVVSIPDSSGADR
jgi:signal transduction histidine kinase